MAAMNKMLLSVLLCSLFLSACGSSSEDPAGEDPTKDLVALGAESTDGLSVKLFADSALHVGLNQIHYRLEQAGGKAVKQASITQLPVMHMQAMGKEHSCPHEQPAATADERGLFPALVVFQMASGATDSWRDEVNVDLGDGAAQSVVFENLAVAESDARKDLSVPDGSGGERKVIVTLNFAAAPALGQNPFTLTLHEKADMHGMTWQPLTDWTLVVTPEMPAMGHGSPDNVNPTHVASGRYDGSVNLTMPGLWKVAFDFAQAGTSLGSVEYDVEL